MALSLKLFVGDASGGPIRREGGSDQGPLGAMSELYVGGESREVLLLVMGLNRGDNVPPVAQFNLGVQQDVVKITDPGHFQRVSRLHDVLGEVIGINNLDGSPHEPSEQWPVSPAVHWLELLWESHSGQRTPLWANNTELIPLTELKLELKPLGVASPVTTWIAWRCVTEAEQNRGVATLWYGSEMVKVRNLELSWKGESEP